VLVKTGSAPIKIESSRENTILTEQGESFTTENRNVESDIEINVIGGLFSP
jgi:hypothetical protein